MHSKPHIQAVVLITVLVLVVGIWVESGNLNWTFFKACGVATFAATIALSLWERVAWKLSLVQRLDFVPRDVAGTWKGTLHSFWRDPQTGASPPPKTAYLVVRQTASTVRVTLLTDESISRSALGALVGGVDARLDYFFLNRPDLRFQERSRPHYGSASLNVIGKPAERLRGQYWTDRDSRGELEFDCHTRSVAEDYVGAARLFSSQ